MKSGVDMEKCFIITGASGFLGSRLASALVNEGYKTVCVSRFQKQGFITWENMTEAVNGAYCIVNLAGENISKLPWDKKQKQKILESRIIASRAVVNAVEKASVKPKILIQASASGYYGDTGDNLTDETGKKGDGFLPDVCEKWENETKKVEEMGVTRCVIRTAPVLGKGGLLSAMEPVFKLWLGGKLGNGRQLMSFIHVDDWVRAIIFLAELKKNGIYNLCSPMPVSNSQFTAAFAHALHRTHFMRAPAFVLRIIFGNDAAKGLFLNSQAVFPKALLDAGFKFRHAEINEALTQIYHPGVRLI